METQKIDNKWISQFDSHERWFRGLKRRSRNDSLSDGMTANYSSVLKQLMVFANSKVGISEIITPDSLIEWAERAESEEIVDLLNGFEQWLQGKEVEGYSTRVPVGSERLVQPNTAYTRTHGVARGFFSHNKVWLPKGKRTNGHVTKTKKNDVNFAIFKYDSDVQKVVQDYTELRYFLSNLSFRDQTIALCLLSTSQDISNLLDLKIGFVTSQVGRDRLVWEETRTKTGEIFRVFFSREATKYLRQYIMQERQGAELDDPIFVRTGNKEILTPRHVSSTFRTVAKKMGIDNGEAQNPFRPKRLRSIFSTACYQAKIDDGARHIFMGHSATMSEKYREIPPANLEAIYAQVEPFLTVYAEDNTAELAETKRKSEKALDLVLDIREENKELRDQIAKLTEDMMNLGEQFGRMEGLRERIEELEDYVEIGVLRKQVKEIEEKKKSIEEIN